MRYFIALEIPSENKLQFQSFQEKLSTIIPHAKITDLAKLHLTFAFIGEQPEDIKQDLVNVLKKASYQIPAFEITPAYVDGFPNIHQPKVIWVGVKGDIDKIIILRERIKDGLSTLKLDVDERRFVPHITVAKISENDFELSLNTEEQMQNLIHNAFTPIKITSIKLFESVPDGGFHRHNTLAEILLI